MEWVALGSSRIRRISLFWEGVEIMSTPDGGMLAHPELGWW